MQSILRLNFHVVFDGQDYEMKAALVPSTAGKFIMDFDEINSPESWKDSPKEYRLGPTESTTTD
jgi:hypothetical protein